MSTNELLSNPFVKTWLGPALVAVVVIGILFFVFRALNKSRTRQNQIEQESASVKNDNAALREELRHRIVDHIKFLSRILQLHPVIPGNTPENVSLEGRNRTRCLELISEGLPQDPGSQGIRMAEFLHQLCDHLLKSYGKEDIVNIKIDAHPVILEVESAVSVGLILNELISNAIQYGQEPGVKGKINIFFKERDDKLVINVADNGIGMKVPYVPKYSFGLQLTSTIVTLHKGDIIISSRPGTRVEILLSDYKTAVREVFITPTRRIY